MTDILPDPPASAVRRRTPSPLVDLLRTTVSQYGEVTFRLLPPDDPQADTGCVDLRDPVIYLPAETGDLQMLVSALYQISMAGTERWMVDSAERFVLDATRRTLGAMGVAR